MCRRVMLSVKPERMGLFSNIRICRPVTDRGRIDQDEASEPSHG